MGYTKFIYNLFDNNFDKSQKVLSVLSAFVGVMCLIIIQCFMLYNVNKHNYEEIAVSMLDNIDSIIKENKAEKAERMKDYHRYAIEDINDVCDIIDFNNISYTDVKTFERFSNISMLNDFSIYDNNGVKIGGLKPEEYGTKMADDEAKRNFLPLLDGIKTDMCMDINTEDHTNTMYAAAWNHSQKYILLIATDLDDEYFQDEFAAFDMDRLISHMSVNQDSDIIVVDEDGTICASTNKSYDNLSVGEIGIKNIVINKNENYRIMGDDYYGYFKMIDGHKIGVIKKTNIINEDMVISIIITITYLIVFFIVLKVLFSITMNIVNMQKRKEEKLENEANNDGLTGLYNRRAYDKEVARYNNMGLKDDLVVVAIDINGLKKANDTLGHEAGDELILGAAKCLQSVFETYGHVYRTGGDEFIAIISVGKNTLEKIKSDLQKKCDNWQGKLVERLTLSAGYASVRDYKCQDIVKLVKTADENMYKAKQEFYKTHKELERR